eukprot:6180195-Pleurochrysis_carterae.AAC.1
MLALLRTAALLNSPKSQPSSVPDVKVAMSSDGNQLFDVSLPAAIGGDKRTSEQFYHAQANVHSNGSANGSATGYVPNGARHSEEGKANAQRRLFSGQERSDTPVRFTTAPAKTRHYASSVRQRDSPVTQSADFVTRNGCPQAGSEFGTAGADPHSGANGHGGPCCAMVPYGSGKPSDDSDASLDPCSDDEAPRVDVRGRSASCHPDCFAQSAQGAASQRLLTPASSEGAAAAPMKSTARSVSKPCERSARPGQQTKTATASDIRAEARATLESIKRSFPESSRCSGRSTAPLRDERPLQFGTPRLRDEAFASMGDEI